MQEVIKRIDSGWVMMDSYSKSNGNVLYFFERGEKAKCMIEVEPSGHGTLFTTSGSKRI